MTIDELLELLPDYDIGLSYEAKTGEFKIRVGRPEWYEPIQTGDSEGYFLRTLPSGYGDSLQAAYDKLKLAMPNTAPSARPEMRRG